MRISDKIKRAVAFYISVLLFLITLPIILSNALGYRIDFKTQQVYGTGIIFINSTPAGASIYINDKLCKDVTPTQIEQLSPGAYKVRVKREGFYPWEEELAVRPNMVTKADKIVLFPVINEMKKIGASRIMDFALSDHNYIYYLTESGLFRSGMDGGDMKKLASYSNWPKNIIRKKFSPDGNKFLCFNERHIVVVYINLEKQTAAEADSAKVEEVLISEEPVLDAFWYTGSGYIIVVTEKYINVMELRGGGKRNIAPLYKFNARPHSVYYDENNGALYFTDIQKGSGLKAEAGLYRLDLRQKFFDYLMGLLIKKEAGDTNAKK